MIIFGWGHQTIKIFGPTFSYHCSHCDNEEYWVLTRCITWFTVFFIPIIPYSFKYFLSCPICQYGITPDNQQVEQIKPIAEVNQLLISKKITEIEYRAKIAQLENGESSSVEGKIIKEKSSSISGKNKFCSKCGFMAAKDMKFCGNCGVKIFD